MFSKIAYAYDHEFYYLGEVECFASPREPGVWKAPANSTFESPPEAPADKEVLFDEASNGWVFVDKRKPQVNEEVPLEDLYKEQPFQKLNPIEKKQKLFEFQLSKLARCSQALESMMWADQVGNPVDPDLKKEWFDYRKALLTSLEGITETTLIKLKNAEDFTWPVEPTMPDQF
jgi:hypothetical protein